MEWIKLISAFGLGAILIKLLDIVWLQRVLQEHEQRTWLRDKRLEAFSTLAKEFISFGLHRQGPPPHPFEQFALAAEAMLLVEDDSLIDRLDQFVVKLDQLYQLSDESSSEADPLYHKLTEEARLIVKELRDILVKDRGNRTLRFIDFLQLPLKGNPNTSF